MDKKTYKNKQIVTNLAWKKLTFLKLILMDKKHCYV